MAQGVRTRFEAERRPESIRLVWAPFGAVEVEELLRGRLELEASPRPVGAESWMGPGAVLEGEVLTSA